MLNKHKRSSRQNRKPSVLFVLAIAFQLTALAVVATATQAFAQLPGESSGYTHELINDPSQNSIQQPNNLLKLQYTYSEARNGGHLLSVWRGCDCNGNNDPQVWMSIDNGDAFTIGGTVTNASPTVVPWGPVSFLVFHTGVNGDIFYTAVFSDGSNWGTWFNVPGNFTNMSVSVAQMGPGSDNVYMVYRGLGNDQRVWGTWFSGQNRVWSTPENISGGLGNSSPGVSMNNVSNRLTVTVGGTDSQLWMTSQALGAHGWNNWTPMGVSTFDTPHSAACANGNMVVSIRDINSHPEFAKFDAKGDQLSGFSVDTSGFQTNWAVQLTANGNSVYSLIHGLENDGWWKQVYDCN
jgi:hypothetical protein